MKKLWQVIPPCYSDIQGFEAVLNNTTGFGVVDDSGHYKPIGAKLEHGGHGHGGHGHGDHQHGHGDHGDRPKNKEGRRKMQGDMRITHSNISTPDIITGTEKRVLEAFYNGYEQLNPDFALLSHAPSSSMIGSDLEYVAKQINDETNLPITVVNIDGEKDYLHGISYTLEAMGKLLLTKQDTIPNTINILGLNSIDFSLEEISQIKEMFEAKGYQILSCWGCKETTDNLKQASKASLNIVVNESGLKLAYYMKKEFDIPYIINPPYGTENDNQPVINSTNDPEVIIIGEQLMANSIRTNLITKGYKDIRVLSFYDMDKNYMETGDKKLTGEDDLQSQLSLPSVKIVFGSPDYKPLATSEVKWINLNNRATPWPINQVTDINLIGSALDEYLVKVGL